MTTVTDLTHATDLSVGQVARLLDVSARQAAGWVHGDAIPDHITVRLNDLLNVIEPLGENPAARRRAVLNSSRGRSVFHQLIAEHPQMQVIHYQAISVRDRLG